MFIIWKIHGGGGGPVVSALAFYSNNPSLNPANPSLKKFSCFFILLHIGPWQFLLFAVLNICTGTITNFLCSPILMVMGGDSFSKVRGFKTHHCILDGHFCLFEKSLNERKRGRWWPTFKETFLATSNCSKLNLNWQSGLVSSEGQCFCLATCDQLSKD